MVYHGAYQRSLDVSLDKWARDIKGFHNMIYWVGLTNEKLEHVGFLIYFLGYSRVHLQNLRMDAAVYLNFYLNVPYYFLNILRRVLTLEN